MVLIFFIIYGVNRLLRIVYIEKKKFQFFFLSVMRLTDYNEIHIFMKRRKISIFFLSVVGLTDYYETLSY